MTDPRPPAPAALPLAIALGDPAGIGPEVIAAAWSRAGAAPARANPPFFVCGGASVLAQAGARVVLIGDPAEAAAAFARGLPVLPGPDGDYHPGTPDRAGAALALASLGLAVELARTRRAGAVVTGPVAKAQIAEIDPGFIGQTEFCADMCGRTRADAVMLLAGPQLKVVPLTVHCALAEVPRLVTRELILHRARIIARAMAEDFGIAAPHIAICGLNPHAGEAGRMGREEIDVIAPAIAQLQAEGIDASGPHPADTLFAPHIRPTFDVALAMYHDQALAPLKALDFDAGVNITLGLPIVRTSPDHGTAFGIAGKAAAHPGAMIAAIRMAGDVARAAALADPAELGLPVPDLPPLREVIKSHGLAAQKSLGQNFLLDEQLLARIAAVPGALAGRAVLEIGPGPGGLTRALLRAGARVTAIERDRRCIPALEELGAAFPGQLRLIEDDALALDHAALMGEDFAVLANLPYNIGTVLFTRWLGGEAWPPRWTSLTLMFQHEVAQRIVAAADTDPYGRLAVLAQWRSSARLAMKVHRSAFTPPPKVMSAVVHVEPATMPDGVHAAKLERLTEAAFGQRRKMLRQSLKGQPGALHALAELGIDPTRRAETLSVAEFVAIARLI